MRRAYRRLFFPLFIFSILTMFILVFQVMFRRTQDNIVSLFYDSQIFSSQLSMVPSDYLVIPYREFVLRTSMACRAFKLDDPKENRAKLHPQYSKYLRGRFPFVIPYQNITLMDVENLFTKTLVNKKSSDNTIKTTFAKNISFEHIPYQYRDGMWYPIGVTSAQRTAIVVPLQGREYNAKAFLLNMHEFVRRQQLTYTILFAEQISSKGSLFNKGRLYNSAVHYLENQSLNITCIILHDVDLIPEDDGNFYSCERSNPKHTTSRVRQLNSTRGYARYYEFLIGGVLMLTFDMYKKLNGFSNLYWGWGGEDDDLALRFVQQKMCVVRPSYELATYTALPHPGARRNHGRLGLLTWTTLRLEMDGYAQIGPLTRIINVQQTRIVTRLLLDVNVSDYSYRQSLSNNPLSLIKTSSVNTNTTK